MKRLFLTICFALFMGGMALADGFDGAGTITKHTFKH